MDSAFGFLWFLFSRREVWIATGIITAWQTALFLLAKEDEDMSTNPTEDHCGCVEKTMRDYTSGQQDAPVPGVNRDACRYPAVVQGIERIQTRVAEILTVKETQCSEYGWIRQGGYVAGLKDALAALGVSEEEPRT